MKFLFITVVYFR